MYKDHAFPLSINNANKNTFQKNKTLEVARIRKVSPNTMSLQTKAEQEAHNEKWTTYTAAQNLPAVLNDPGRGKQVSNLKSELM